MAFIAACPFCQRLVQAPDGALGQSIACKKCKNHFTLAPADDVPAPRSGPNSAVMHATAARPQPAPPRAARTGPDDTLEHAVVATAPDLPPLEAAGNALPAIAPSPVAPPAPATPWNLFAVATLLLSSLALVCATVSWLQWLTIPLAGAGLLSGVICVVGTPIESTRDAIVLGLGGVVTPPTLLIALFWPAVLGLDTRLAPERPPALDPNRQTIQPRRDRAGNTAILTPQALEANAWADAERFDVDHGNVRLRIVEVSRREAPKTKRKNRKPEQELVIVVMLSHVGTKGPVTFQGWRDAAAPRLRDAMDSAFEFKGRGADATGVGRSLVPFRPVRETLVFAAPPATTDLRLELPASAIGGDGTVRFHLPATMSETSGAWSAPRN